MATKSGPKRPPSWLKELKTNDNLWLRDEEQEWTLGVAEGFADGALQMKMPDGTVRNVKPIDGDIHQANDGVANDMCGLHHINEATILDALQKRSEVQDKRTKAKGGDGVREEMYTYMASVVIAVNPLDGSLTDPQPDIFSKPHERSPHPYDLAETAFKQMCSRTSESGRDQSIVVSGESGSGKTESSKIVLYYLAQRGSSTTAAAGTKTLDKMLLDTNPILEAFGNAKTLRNNNSSRFGKFMKLQFDNTNFQLQGGMVETYLLEKSRVCHQITGERDFHVFYQLLKGCDTDAELATQVCKENADRFDFLKSGGTLEVHGHDDGAHFQEMRSALQTIGVTKETETVLFQLIMAVAHIGNAKFRDEETVEGEKAVPEDDTPLKTAAQLLGVEHEQLSDSILQREIKAMGSTIIKQRNATAAGYARNAVAKELYLRIFDWVVQKVNMSLGQVAAEGNCFIGVLDIFGFESFEVNDFEQLLINFTNEVLQATFNEQVFNAETELYKSEGLEVASVSWPDNRECVELISSTPSGVLSLLDAEAKNPKPKDKKFLSQVHKVHGFNPFCPKPHPKDRDRQFIVRHFAGHVTYTIGNFIDKNNNEVPDDIAKLFAVSKLHNLSDTAATGAPPVPAGRPGAAKKKPTVAAVFKRQMAELVQTLEKTRCSFIRCIKPNAASTVGVFDRKYVTKQLQNQGIVQTAEVLRLGLPTRVKYDIVAQQFRQKLPGEINDIYKHESDQAFVRAIMWAFDVPADTFKCGTTRIFFKVGKMALLDQVLQADLDNTDEVARITAKLRRYVQFKRWRRALVKVQAYNVWVRLFEFVAARKSAAIQRIQNMFRQKAARDEYARKQEEAVENKRRDAEEANRVEQQSKREHDSQQRRSKDASLAAIKGNNEARRVADDEVRERAEATETSRRARQKAKEEADAAAREAAEKAAREAEEAQRKKEEEARVAREKAEAEQKRLAEQQAEAQRKEEEAKRQAEEQRKKKEAADAEEEKARKEKEMADQARTEEEAARKASLANAPKEDDKFLEPEPRGARSHNLVGEAEHQALVAGTHQDSDFDADELAETLDMLGVKVTDNDGQPVEQNHPDWQRFAKVALLQAKSKRAEASSNAGTRGSIMPHKSGQGDEEHKSVVRASIRASVAQNTGGTKAKKKVRSNKAAHLLTVNQMSQSGWLDEDQAAQLQQVIMDGADDASFPVDTLKQWGLSLEDLANVLGGEDQVASLKAITEDDDDEEDDGEPEDYTKVYADSLWRVNQLVCPCCSNFNNSKDGNRCKVCGAQMFGHPDLVDAEKGGEKITTDEPDILDDESKLDDEDDDLSKPHCNFKEGILVITVYGSMDTMDHQTLSEYTEYVVMCEWGPPQGDPDRSEKKHWLVAARFSEFKDMHKRLAKRMRQILPQGTDFPKLHKKNMMLQAKKKRVEERQQALQKFWIDLMKLLDSYPQLLAHINELDQFLALSERVTAIKKNILQKQEERKLKAEREGETETLSMTKQKTFVVRPMNGDMIQQAMYVIEQFTRLVQAAQSDIRYEQDIQHLLRVCLGFLPQLQASATDGPFVDPENITHAEQCLYDLHEATCLYNEEVALFMADG